jgi:hypothetical protein
LRERRFGGETGENINPAVRLCDSFATINALWLQWCLTVCRERDHRNWHNRASGIFDQGTLFPGSLLLRMI